MRFASNEEGSEGDRGWSSGNGRHDKKNYSNFVWFASLVHSLGTDCSIFELTSNSTVGQRANAAFPFPLACIRCGPLDRYFLISYIFLSMHECVWMFQLQLSSAIRNGSIRWTEKNPFIFYVPQQTVWQTNERTKKMRKSFYWVLNESDYGFYVIFQLAASMINRHGNYSRFSAVMRMRFLDFFPLASPARRIDESEQKRAERIASSRVRRQRHRIHIHHSAVWHSKITRRVTLISFFFRVKRTHSIYEYFVSSSGLCGRDVTSTFCANERKSAGSIS